MWEAHLSTLTQEMLDLEHTYRLVFPDSPPPPRAGSQSLGGLRRFRLAFRPFACPDVYTFLDNILSGHHWINASDINIHDLLPYQDYCSLWSLAFQNKIYNLSQILTDTAIQVPTPATQFPAGGCDIVNVLFWVLVANGGLLHNLLTCRCGVSGSAI